MYRKLLLFTLLQSITRQSDAINWFNDASLDANADTLAWSKHPCRRACKDYDPLMECHYVFHVEHYYAMSKACYDCPRNHTDCFRPHCIPADGIERSIVVVNRQMPGPAIEVCEGDRIFVNVINKLHAESTTIHWHGHHMRSTPYMDGTPYVTQCPISPGDAFRYVFNADNPGTHFWHSHVGFQRGDGLAGAMIVRQAPTRNYHQKLYDFDEHTIFISDWDHLMGLDKFVAYHHGDGRRYIIPPNFLINGLGRFETRSKPNVTHMPTAIFSVKQKFRYRFRIINAEFENCPVEVSIDNHNLLIVSSDGKDVKPLTVKSLVTYAGERFDVVVEMDQDINNYWIRFRGLMNCEPKYGPQNAYQIAILRYEGAPDADPKEEYSYDLPPEENLSLQINSLNMGTESTDSLSIVYLKSMDKNSPANTKKPDYQFFITYDFYWKDNEEFHRHHVYGVNQVDTPYRVETPQLNHISMKTPPFPLLSQRELIDSSMFCNESTVRNCENNYCSCTHVLEVKLGSIVELVLIDEGLAYDANHPFHLHGHNFRVVAMRRLASNVTLEDIKKADREGKIHRNLDRAPIKDTVTVPDGGYTILRFEADNPGYWLFHCHIEFHSEVGMALIFKVGEHEEMPPTPQDFPTCGKHKSILQKNRKLL